MSKAQSVPFDSDTDADPDCNPSPTAASVTDGDLANQALRSRSPPTLPPLGVIRVIRGCLRFSEVQPPPNISRHTTTAATTPVASAINPAHTACRTRRTATEPK